MTSRQKAPFISIITITLTTLIVYGFATLPPLDSTPPLTQSQNQPQLTTSTQPIPPAQINTPNWNQFTSFDNSLSFFYPPDWFITPLTQSSQLGTDVNLIQALTLTSTQPSSQELIPSSLQPEDASLEFAIIDTGDDPSLLSSFDCSNTDLPACSTRVINGTDFSQITLTSSDSKPATILVTSTGSKLIVISTSNLSADNSSTTIQAIINSININPQTP